MSGWRNKLKRLSRYGMRIEEIKGGKKTIFKGTSLFKAPEKDKYSQNKYLVSV